ncbi:MAG: cupredoxin domain-containing protein [Gemmatimonadaceae bacterium]
MRMNSVYLATAILCVAACGKSSDSGSTNSGVYGGSGPTTPTTPSNNPAPSAPNTVNANPGLAFNPALLTVTAGTTVTFSFGDTAHTVTFTTAGAPANIPATSNADVSVTFPTAGTYNYMCTIHPYMTGTIVVN